MKKFISLLKDWNKAYPEHAGMLQLRFYDDESGEIYCFMTDEQLFYFHSFEILFSTNPAKYKLEHPNG
jgi:hypothetical protein